MHNPLKTPARSDQAPETQKGPHEAGLITGSLVAGTGVDHNLRSTPVKMVAGGRNHLYLQASCNEASKVTAEEAVGEVQSFLTNLFQTAA